MPENKQVRAGYLMHNSILRITDAFAVPDHQIRIDWLIKLIFTMRIIGMANYDFFITCFQLNDEG